MSNYTIHSHVYLRASRRELWEFLCDPSNLITLTPPRFDIQPKSTSHSEFGEGAILAFSLKPLPGFRATWVSKISHVREGEFFVDEQLSGPYAYWYHRHELKDMGEQCVLVKDQVFYGLPFGPLGSVLNGPLVEPGLKETFRYRARRFQEIFGKCEGYEPELRITELK